MARKRSKSNKARVNGSQTVGALADDDVASSAMGTNVDGDIYITGVKLMWSMQAQTVGQGPKIVGIAHPDLSEAEIEECLEASTSFSVNDRIAREQASRPVSVVGSFPAIAVDEVLNQGEPIWTRLGYHIAEGDKPFTIWCFNKSGSTMNASEVVKIVGDGFFRRE